MSWLHECEECGAHASVLYSNLDETKFLCGKCNDKDQKKQPGDMRGETITAKV